MEKDYLGCHVSMEKLQNQYSESEERADTANTQVNYFCYYLSQYFFYYIRGIKVNF